MNRLDPTRRSLVLLIAIMFVLGRAIDLSRYKTSLSGKGCLPILVVNGDAFEVGAGFRLAGRIPMVAESATKGATTMAYTDEKWFTYFHAKQGNPRGSKDRATVQDTNGAVILEISPASPHYRPRPQTAQLLADFEDNVRLAGAAREMFVSLRQLLQAAIDAGIPVDAAVIRNAQAAIEMAAPQKFEARHDGVVKYTGTHNECFGYIHNSQGQSFDYAVKHGGWSIERAADLAPAADEAPGSGLALP
ncbi:hypothetical protein ACVIGB_000852 [Bradyrhizobium sp. USDA 4341]